MCVSQANFAQNDVPSTPEAKCEALLTPQYYTNWIGASFFTISTIEHELDVTPVKITGLTFSMISVVASWVWRQTKRVLLLR